MGSLFLTNEIEFHVRRALPDPTMYFLLVLVLYQNHDCTSMDAIHDAGHKQHV